MSAFQAHQEKKRPATGGSSAAAGSAPRKKHKPTSASLPSRHKPFPRKSDSPSVVVAHKPESAAHKKRAILPPLSLSTSDPCEWFAQAYAAAQPSASLLEQSDLTARVSFGVSGELTEALARFAPLATGPAGAGPQVLLITPNTERAIEWFHAVVRPNVGVAKLFARHLKQDEQAALLASKGVAAAVGTPNRLLRLAQAQQLPLSRLTAVVLDMKPDVKTFTLATMPAVRDDFFALWALLKQHSPLVQAELLV